MTQEWGIYLPLYARLTAKQQQQKQKHCISSFFFSSSYLGEIWEIKLERYMEVALGMGECSTLIVIKHYSIKLWRISERL